MVGDATELSRGLSPILGACDNHRRFRRLVFGIYAETIASLSATGQEEVAQEPQAMLMMVMAAGMGLVAGLVLGFPQWRVLRRYVERGWLWLLANSMAWAMGIPVIFAGVDLAQRSGTIGGAILAMAGALAAAGLSVGAIHGPILVKLSQ
jgi:hypothetical protein